jgi:hypothetical protein
MESDTRPAIFYAPYPDDEAIAMAGTIRRNKGEGRPVYLVLQNINCFAPRRGDMLSAAFRSLSMPPPRIPRNI